MRRAIRLPIIGSLVLLLTSTVTVYAEPIAYSVTGQIRFGGGAYEDFEGSFILSDPLVSLWDSSDSRGDQRDLYTVSDFRLSSASFSIAQSGFGAIGVWWELYRGRGVAVNGLDSAVTVNTSAGLLDTDWSFPRWEGDPGTQPTRFSGLTERVGPPGGYSVLNMTAETYCRPRSIPEPSALLLYGVGIGGWALLRRRNTT